MKLFIKILDKTNDYLIDYYSNYKPHHVGDVGIDLICPSNEDFTTPTYCFGYGIHLGIACQPDDPTHGYYLYPRSSMSNTTLRMSNSVGIIDPNYRGEIIAKVDIFRSYKINKGDRLFQLCSYDLSPIEIEVVNNLNETSRGVGGFGSTN